ncbi:molybdopterin-dependent oxidoreductase, partial [Klebsiella pneumoniae]
IALLNALMHVLISEDIYDHKFVESCTVGFDELKAKVMNYPPERVADICGIDAGIIRDTARRLAAVKPVMVCYTLGI